MTDARAMLEQMLPLLRDKRLDALADLYAADGVHELPFAPAAAPRRIQGRERIREYFTTTLMQVPLTFTDFEPVAVHDTADPGVLVAEYDAHGHTATGRAFVVRYLWVLEVAAGRISRWRDYFNPQEVLALTAG